MTTEQLHAQPIWMREILEEREREFFSPVATFSDNAVRRRKELKVETGYRQNFSIDADRILHSLAYTRYIDKTQVFSLIRNDHLTHRVLHVQLVSRIARTIGRYLGLNEDLIEAASLGHDLGHPPFGHDGERILSTLTFENGAGYFHHNLHSLQILEKLEQKGAGCNISLQTLDAILCHNGELHDNCLKPVWKRDFAEMDQLALSMRNSEKNDIAPMTMEGCVLRIADTIGYIGRDVEDAIRLNLIKREELPLKAVKILGSTNGTIVYNLVTDVIASSFRQPFVAFSEEISEALKELKEFNYRRIYLNPAIKSHMKSVESIYHHLFGLYMNDLEKEKRSSVIFTGFLSGLPEEYIEGHSHPEIVRDFIAGMTDSYFIEQAPESLRPPLISLSTELSAPGHEN